MSGTNPYAVNGYSGSNQNVVNPYASQGGGRYADPYITQANDSSASVNSYGSRDRERRRRSNPYAEQNIQQSDERSVSGGGGGGYGGLGRPQAEYGYDEGRYNPRSGNTLQSSEPEAHLQPPQQQQPRTGIMDRERGDRGYGDNSRSRERREPRPSGLSQEYQQTSPSWGHNGYNLTPQSSNTALSGSGERYIPPSSRRPTKNMDQVLKHIQSNWKTMEGDECVPVKIALQLMDPSSLGLADREGDFSATHVELQKCLKGVVNEHYADFNSAVGTYHKIQNAIKESQSRVRMLKGGLMGVKSGMLSTRPELRGLAETSGQLDDMVGLLTLVEELKVVSGRLEEKISEKKFLSAVDLLNESLGGLRKKELDEIGALVDLKSYFSNQESSLIDILVEELHDHLYLKSPYCAERWRKTTANGEVRDAKQGMVGEGVNAWDRPVYHYLSTLDTSAAMVEDVTKNPETDTFYYIHMILESLTKLGHLDEAISRIEQRMPVELYKVVEKTNNEIDIKYPSRLRGQIKKDKKAIMSIRVSEGPSQVLSDFLWTLYSKFEAITEGHRVLHEVVVGIVTREGMSKAEKYTGGFKELWKLYQMEMRSILHDYLATDGDMTLRTSLTSATSTDVFGRQHRDKNKRMFKLSEMDQKSASIKAEEDELEAILKSSVPGLVNKSRANVGVNNNSERNGHESTAAGHKLLIEPGVFNMTVLLPPSLAFLQHLKDLVPQSSNIPMSTLTSFLDDFLINIFHPQLEEAVTELCTRSMIDIEAFTEDTNWSKHSPHPIFKGTLAFMTLIKSFSEMLSSIPQDQMFTQLLINQMVTYYDKCYGYYKAIVSRVAAPLNNSQADDITMKAAAAYAHSGDIHDVAIELLQASNAGSARKDLITKEVQDLLSATKLSPLTSYDIISDTKSVHQLCLLHNSVQWLSSALTQLRRVDTTITTKSHSRNPSQTQNTRRWTLIKAIRPPGTASPASTGIFLPLSSETVIPFDHTLSSFRTLAQISILTLHIDIRCGIIQQLSRVLRGPDTTPSTLTPSEATQPSPITRIESSTLPPLSSGAYPFVLPKPPTSASPLILQLNNDLITFDANIASYLGLKERRFITTGLSRLVDRYLVLGADNILVMNANGAERVRVDAMVLQQNLRGIVAGSVTPSATSTTKTTKRKQSAGKADNNDPKNAAGLGISTDANTKSASAVDEEEEDDGLLTASNLYYTLFLSGPDEIMAYARFIKPPSPPPSADPAASSSDAGTTTIQKSRPRQEPSLSLPLTDKEKQIRFNYDELRTLLELSYSASLRGEDREESLNAKKKLADRLIELGEILWDS